MLGKTTNFTIMAIIVASVLLSMTGTMQHIDEAWLKLIQATEFWVTLLFTVEFFARCYAAKNMRAYLFSFYGRL